MSERQCLKMLAVTAAVASIMVPASLPASATATVTNAAAAPTLKVAVSTADDGYQLGVGDSLRITIYEREDLSRVYRVNDNGTVHIPFLGEFNVVDTTTGQLEASIVSKFTEMLGQKPQVIVEVTERRPFFIVGLVSRPGSYPFVARMTALHAVALAGGIYRLGSNAFLAADARRETTRVEQTREDLKRALARLSRLQAERTESDEIKAPPRLIRIAGKRNADELIAHERQLMRQRKLSHERRISAFRMDIELHTSEAKTLREQLSFIKQQRDLKAQHSEEIQKLQSRGLANRVQALNLLGDVSSLERDYRAAVAGETRARQELARSERDYELYKYQHTLELDQQIADLQLEIIKLDASIRGSQTFIRDVTGMNVSLSSESQTPTVEFQIMRQIGAQTEILPATETTRLKPGDILRVMPKPVE